MPTYSEESGHYPQNNNVHHEANEQVRYLLAPLLDNPQSEKSGWRLAGWDYEAGISIYLEGHGRVLLVELEERNDEIPCYARTSMFNITIRRLFHSTGETDRMERAIADRLACMIAAREKKLITGERPTTGRRTFIRTIKVNRVLIPEGNGHYYVNPYIGCTIGCPFCWAAKRADFSRKLEGLPEMPWGRWVDVKINAHEILAGEIKRLPPGPVRFSPVVTDPYQPIERKYRITRQCLKLLIDGGFTPVILTRSALILEDMDLLQKNPDTSAGFSIPTDDDRIRAIYEPGADPLEDRFDALDQLRSRNIKTFAFIQPLLPMNPSLLSKRLADLVKTVRIDRMHLSSGSSFPSELVSDYRLAGMPDITDPSFYAPLISELSDNFQKLGVSVEELEDFSGRGG